MDRTCPACSARLDQQAATCPQCGADLAASGTDQSTEVGVAGEVVRNTAGAAHLSTFAGLVVPFGSVIGPLAVWLTRRHRDPGWCWPRWPPPRPARASPIAIR
jgi:hypothetical protein